MAQNIHIRTFDEAMLGDAADLLATRHRRDRETLSVLPSRFEDAEFTIKALYGVWARPHVIGVAAFQGNIMVGFLIGYHLSGSLSDRTGWIPLAGHAIHPDYAPHLYHELYAALAERWVDYGILAHYVMVSAGDSGTLMQWFGLGFGQQQAYGVRTLTEKDTLPSIPVSIDIRHATSADEKVVEEIADTNVRYQNGSPVFAPTPPEYVDELREGYVELVNDNEEGTLWLAIQNGKVVGYQAYTFVEDDPSNLFIPDQSIELPAAGTIESVRGQGIGRILTQYGFAQAKAGGYRYVVADWRTTNMLASRFWAANDFQPVAYRLERRIDPKISWARLR